MNEKLDLLRMHCCFIFIRDYNVLLDKFNIVFRLIYEKAANDHLII